MFVTFEGLDGSGKSTQADRLRARLETENRDVVSTREPGGTDLGERVRDLVLHGGHVTPWAEALLYAAARAQHVDEIIRPALERGAWVLCDRYVDSSAAYQGVARGLGLERVLDLNLVAVGGLMPDRTFLLELDPRTPSSGSGADHDRLEREGTLSALSQPRPTGISRHASPSATSSSMPGARPTSSPRRSMGTSSAAPEQPEAARLLEAALRGRHAGARLPPARAARRREAHRCVRLRLRAARRHAPRGSAHAPGPVRARAARRDDPDRRRARAPARPAHASVRGARAACTSCSTPSG